MDRQEVESHDKNVGKSNTPHTCFAEDMRFYCIRNPISCGTPANLTLAAEPWKCGMRALQVTASRCSRTHHRLVFTSINLPSYFPFCISGCFPVPVAAVQGADFIRICFVKCFSALYDAFALFLSVSAKPLKNAKGRALKVKTK